MTTTIMQWNQYYLSVVVQLPSRDGRYCARANLAFGPFTTAADATASCDIIIAEAGRTYEVCESTIVPIPRHVKVLTADVPNYETLASELPRYVIAALESAFIPPDGLEFLGTV